MGKQAMGVYIVLLLCLYRKMGQWLWNNSDTDMSIYTKKEKYEYEYAFTWYY